MNLPHHNDETRTKEKNATTDERSNGFTTKRSCGEHQEI